MPVVRLCFVDPAVADALSKSVPSRQELAELIVTIPSTTQEIPKSKQANWLHPREQLFLQQPLPVLIGLVRADRVPAPLGSKDLIIALLRVALESPGFDIRTSSLRDLLAMDDDDDISNGPEMGMSAKQR
ncbi:hypothetical protein BDV19DRAFT_389940 [Aspergillus venezuelensis]